MGEELEGKEKANEEERKKELLPKEDQESRTAIAKRPYPSGTLNSLSSISSITSTKSLPSSLASRAASIKICAGTYSKGAGTRCYTAVPALVVEEVSTQNLVRKGKLFTSDIFDPQNDDGITCRNQSGRVGQKTQIRKPIILHPCYSDAGKPHKSLREQSPMEWA